LIKDCKIVWDFYELENIEDILSNIRSENSLVKIVQMALKEGETEIAVWATEDLIYTNVNQHKFNKKIFHFKIFTIAIEGAIGPY